VQALFRGNRPRQGVSWPGAGGVQTSGEARRPWHAPRATFPEDLSTAVFGLGCFWGAERKFWQYLHKVPNGYCGLGGTGVSCPVGIDYMGTQNDRTVNGSPAANWSISSTSLCPIILCTYLAHKDTPNGGCAGLLRWSTI
jgi:hypothetical protein